MGTVQMLTCAGTVASGAEPTDLIAAAARGDLGAFESLYRQFSPRVFGLCLRLTGQREAAEDCTQESFVAAWRALGGFEQRSRFTTWLHRIAVHTVLARRRGLRVEYEVAEPAAGLPDVADPGSDAPPLDLERAIAGLPEGARHVLVLVGVYGFSHAEAAQTLGVAEGTCKAQLHRARSLLAAALGLETSR
jgi:RNA polymerase sigma-70 factor (ECF subfamily)